MACARCFESKSPQFKPRSHIQYMEYDLQQLIEQVEVFGQQCGEGMYLQLCQALRDLHELNKYPWAFRVAHKTSVHAMAFDAKKLSTRYMAWCATEEPDLLTHNECKEFVEKHGDDVMIIPIRVPRKGSDVPQFLEDAIDIVDI